MKEYIKNKIIFTLEVITVTIVCVFGMQKENIINNRTTTVENESISKALDRTVIQETQNEIYKKGTYNPIYTFKGELTGYVGDCPLCTGYLACPPRTNVLKKGIYYTDKTYGKIRIVASNRKYAIKKVGRVRNLNVEVLREGWKK